MEYTANHLSFNTLPMEMKEKILEKVNPEDSKKLLKVNKQLRTYILLRGPFYKRFERIEYNFEENGLEIKTYFDGESSNIGIRHFDFAGGLVFYGGNFGRCFSRTAPAPFQFLGRVLPPKTINIHVRDWTFPNLDFLQPALNLRDLIAKCFVLHGFLFDSDRLGYFEDFIKMFSPKLTHSFEVRYSESKVSFSERDDHLLRLKSMLADCKQVKIHLEDGRELLFEALYASNVEKIWLHFPRGEIAMFFPDLKMIATNGVPSRNHQAGVIFQLWYYRDDRDVVGFSIHALLDRIRIDIPSMHRLPLRKKNARKYRRLFEEISAANHITYNVNLNRLWIYETNSPKKCIVFVYYLDAENRDEDLEDEDQVYIVFRSA